MPEALRIVRAADLLIIVGTSLQVSPACDLIREAHYNIRKFLIDPGEVAVRYRQGVTSRLLTEYQRIHRPLHALASFGHCAHDLDVPVPLFIPLRCLSLVFGSSREVLCPELGWLSVVVLFKTGMPPLN